MPPTTAKQPPKTAANDLLDACLSKTTVNEPTPIAVKMLPLISTDGGATGHDAADDAADDPDEQESHPPAGARRAVRHGP